MSKFNITENGNTIINLSLGSLFQNSYSSVHELALQSDDYDLTDISVTPLAVDNDELPASMVIPSKNCYQYIDLSEDRSVYTPTLTLGSNLEFFLKAFIPSYAKSGNFRCSLEAEATCTVKPITGFEDWSHIYIIEITGSIDGDKTDYPVDITLDHSDEMRNDFGDIRFISDDQETVLNYDLVDYTSGTGANFRVKIPDLPKSPDITTIYILTGNSSATTTSDPESVYDFYDSAETDGTSNYTLIDIYNSGVNGTFTHDSENQHYILKNTTYDNIFAAINDLNDKDDLILIADICRATNSGNQQGGLIGRQKTSNTYIEGVYITGAAYIFRLLQNNAGTSTTIDSDNYTISQNEWYSIELKILGTIATLNLYNSTGTLLYTESGEISGLLDSGAWGLRGGYYPNSETYFKNIKALTLTENPPTVSTPSLFGIVGSTSTETETINIDGNVFTDDPTQPPNPQPIQIYAIVGTGEYTNLSSFKIDKNKVDGTSTFSTTIISNEEINIISGQQILFKERQEGQEKEIYYGMIDDCEDSSTKNTYIVTLTGRGISLPLINQSYSLDSGGTTPLSYTSSQLVEQILYDTNIPIGAGVDIDIGIIKNNNKAYYPGWCGDFDTKKEALDSLFALISEFKNKTVNWFVDKLGNFRTFYSDDIDSDIAITITDDNPRLKSIKVKEESGNIVNDLYGYAGENSTLTSHKQDLESIYGFTDENGVEFPGFGIITGSPIKDTSITNQVVLDNKVEFILSRQSKRIYTATLVFTRMPDVELGQPLYVPFISKIAGKTLVISNISMSGSGASASTTITATTDPNGVGTVSDFQAVQAVAMQVVKKKSPRAGTVIETDTGYAVIEKDEGGTLINANTLS